MGPIQRADRLLDDSCGDPGSDGPRLAGSSIFTTFVMPREAEAKLNPQTGLSDNFEPLYKPRPSSFSSRSTTKAAQTSPGEPARTDRAMAARA